MRRSRSKGETRTERSSVPGSPLLSGVNYARDQLAYRLRLRKHESGARHVPLELEESLAYIGQVVADYLWYARIPPDGLRGKRILEIGPGDNLGVALWLIARGAGSVTCLDRFTPKRDEQKNALIYRHLLELLGGEERERAESAIVWRPNGFPEFDPDVIEGRYGMRVEDASLALGGDSFDVIISRAVLEHVSDLRAGWTSMMNMLAPGGEMWHKVDFRNHGFFRHIHPLYFLTVGERSWTLMTSPDPTLNRERAPTYVELARSSSLSHRLYVTHVLEREDLLPHPMALRRDRDYFDSDVALVEAIRPRLRRPFRDMSLENLLTSGIFLIASRTRDLAEDQMGAGSTPETSRSSP